MNQGTQENPTAAWQSGFTLTELAVVLVIVALLIGGLMMPLSAQNDLRRTSETRKTLADINDALLGFATANNRLPCPDTNLDGLEDCTTQLVLSPVAGQSTTTWSCPGTCEGGLPYATLGTSRADSWNNRFRYRVEPLFASCSWVTDIATGQVISVTPGFTLTTQGTIQISTRGDDPATGGVIETKHEVILASKVPAVVISHGKNGSGAVTDDGLALPILASSGPDETANASDGSTKWWRTPTDPVRDCSDTAEGAPFCAFDDLVIWLSPNILYNKMIAAGRLP